MSLAGKVAVVTGSGQGLGLAYAQELAAQGASIVINDVNAEVANAAVASIVDAGGKAVAVVAAVGSTETAKKLVETAVAEFGRLDIMVTNAGSLRDTVLWKMSDDDFDAVINVESSHCYGSVSAFFAEVTRVLRPGGCFLFADLREAPEMAALEKQLAALPGMEVVETEDLTPNVAAALTADHGRKQQMIGELIPESQRAMFREFAGLEGSKIHRNLTSRHLLYYRWALRRIPSD